MYDYKNELKTFPESFGVYIMKDSSNKIIYIGKANNLKKRVFQYFNGTDTRLKIKDLIKYISSIEYIVTQSELESLILENNLIKEHKPKFNTLLKDDKTYPYIEVTLDEDFPRIISSRTIKNNNSKYFGPFPDSNAIKNIISILQKTYKIRVCKTMDDKGCLYHQIKTCSAPCLNKISKEDYMDNINKCVNILNGDITNIVKDYTKKMYDFSSNLEFEKANECKKTIEDLKYIVSKQRVSSNSELNEDVIVNKESLIIVFMVRDGKIIGKEHFFMSDSIGDEDIINSFINQFYLNNSYIPDTILLKEDIDNSEAIIDYLSKIKGKQVSIVVPKKGEKKKLIELAEQNANIILNEKKNKEEFLLKKSTEGLNNLKKLLNIDSLNRIEAFDISNTSGVLNVASMIVFENGKAKKKDYRKFKLETNKNDDYSSMKEVIRRRFTDNKLTSYPNLLLIDGGKGQVSVVLEVLKELNIEIPVCGMFKDDKHNTNGLFFNNKELIISKNSYEFKLITSIQDETHNFAINYHKSLREKELTRSILDNVKGIGDSKKKELLKTFGSIEKIKEASINDLTNVKGISESLANEIKKKLNEENL